MKAGDQFIQVFAGEGPLERSGRLFIAFLETQESVLQRSQRPEIVGRENLALHDREINLDLIEPAGVHRSVNGNNRGPAVLEALDAPLAAMRRAIVENPKDALGRPIGLLTQHFRDQTVERFDAVLPSTAAEHFGPTDIPSCEVDPGPLSLVFALHPGGFPGAGRKRAVQSVTGLNAGLFIGGEHVIPGSQGLSLPEALLEIEDRASFFHEQRIARKNPGSIAPRTDGIFAEPTPNRGPADFRHPSLLEDFLPDVGEGEARQRQPQSMRQFTSESLYLNDDGGGKSGPCARREVHPRGRADGPGKISCAIC
jgi:hypothetical protein